MVEVLLGLSLSPVCTDLEKDYLVIDVWGHMNPEHPRVHGDDVETFTILRAVITAIYEIDEWKKL